MTKDYPEYYGHLQQLVGNLRSGLSGPMSGFAHLHQKAMADGALSSKVKELISLAIAITVRCDGCVAYHVHDAIEAGATREEILEVVGVAVLMGGGPSVIYGSEVLEALEQFQQKRER